MEADSLSPRDEASVDLILKKTFSTLRYMLEQACYAGLPVRKLAMTIPGTGNQQIPRCFVLAPLICRLKETVAGGISHFTGEKQDGGGKRR